MNAARLILLTILSLPVDVGYGAVPKIKVGADILVESKLNLLRNKRVGLITNQTGRLSSGVPLLDELLKHGITVQALFTPEHGLHGNTGAGIQIVDSLDLSHGMPVRSLYGHTRKPTPGMLRDIDVLVYDIQDVGARCYTFISTMGLAMEAAAEMHIPFVVLDRPNPLGGSVIDGPIIEDSLRSFVGMYPIPMVYGLTCGELALMINDRGWLLDKVKADLTVVKMEGWTRDMLWSDTGLEWVPPSPNIPTDSTVILYPGMVLFEATNISEGRGTGRPFQMVGAPWIDAMNLAEALNGKRIPGAVFTPISFIPASSKFRGETCHGVTLAVTDPAQLHPTGLGLAVLQVIKDMYSRDFRITRAFFLRLYGVAIEYDLLSGKVVQSKEGIQFECDVSKYTRDSKIYHLY